MRLAKEVRQRETQIEGRIAEVDHFVIEQHQAAFMNEYVLRTVVAVHQGDAAGQRVAYEGVQKGRGGRRLLRGIAVIGFQAQRFEERAVAEYFREIRAPVCFAVNGREQRGELPEMIGAD